MPRKYRPRSTEERKAQARGARGLERLPVLDPFHPAVHFYAFCGACDEMESCQLYVTETTVSLDAYAIFLCEDCVPAVRPSDAAEQGRR